VKTHQEIDLRSLALAQTAVERIDHDDSRRGLARARDNCARWYEQDHSPAVALDPGKRGQSLRQSNPFCGVLTAAERWAIDRRFRNEQKSA
jgi:hypothetical protein